MPRLGCVRAPPRSGRCDGRHPDEDNLVRAYAPILMLRGQEDPVNDPCKATEEQYGPPTRVEVVLGNPKVKLVHRVGGRDAVVREAPTAADTAGLDGDYYLDLHGDPLSPKCTYSRDYALSLLALAAGPFLGLFLIFLNFSPITVNLIGSIVFALLIPYVAAGRTLLYFDLEAREAEAPAARRRWLPWPRPAETS